MNNLDDLDLDLDLDDIDLDDEPKVVVNKKVQEKSSDDDIEDLDEDDSDNDIVDSDNEVKDPVDELFDGIIKGKKKVKEEKKTTSNPKTESKKEEEKPKKYDKVMKVRVYGQELFSVEPEDQDDIPKELEKIRNRIENEFGYEEFELKATSMHLNELTGVVTPHVKYQNKG